MLGPALYFVAVLGVSLGVDYARHLSRRPIDRRGHRRRWLWRALALAPLAGYLGYPAPLVMLAAGWFLACLFWLLFNGFYSMLRGFHFFDLGSRDPGDPWTDRLLHRNRRHRAAIVCGAVLASGLLFYALRT